MPVLSFIIMDATERAAAMELNDGNEAVIARQIDNPMANQLGYGTLYSVTEPKYIVNAILLNNPDYARWVEMFSDNDIRVMDSEVIFLPEIDE